MKRLSYILIIFISLIGISGCKKDKTDDTPQPTAPEMTLKLKFVADDQNLVFDTIKYVNAAGNQYSVTSLFFYLSQVSLIKADSQKVLIKDWMYVDARTPSTSEMKISSVPEGNYIGMTFNIGIDSTHNVPGGLPTTAENLSMEWPVAMGGGYHFLKFEGHFLDSSGTPGFAMHLGTNNSLCPVQIFGNFCVGTSCSATTLVMNVNEWFRDPWIYDFNIDGNYSMGNMAAMMKLTQNGYNVFTIQ